MKAHPSWLATLPLALFFLGTAAPSAAQSTFYGFTNNLSGTFPLPLSPEVTAARDSFVAAVGAANIRAQDFDTLATGPVPANLPFGAGLSAAFVSSAVGDGTNVGQSIIASGVSAFQEYAISAPNYLSSVTNQGTTFWTMAFSQPIVAVGFYMTDPSDWFAGGPSAGQVPPLRIALEGDSGSMSFALFTGLDPSEVRTGSLGFFGVIDTTRPFDRVSIVHPAHAFAGDAIAIDDMLVATAVPEPGVWALLAAGLGLIMLRRQGASVARRARALSGPARSPCTVAWS